MGESLSRAVIIVTSRCGRCCCCVGSLEEGGGGWSDAEASCFFCTRELHVAAVFSCAVSFFGDVVITAVTRVVVATSADRAAVVLASCEMRSPANIFRTASRRLAWVRDMCCEVVVDGLCDAGAASTVTPTPSTVSTVFAAPVMTATVSRGGGGVAPAADEEGALLALMLSSVSMLMSVCVRMAVLADTLDCRGTESDVSTVCGGHSREAVRGVVAAAVEPREELRSVLAAGAAAAAAAATDMGEAASCEGGGATFPLIV